MQQLSLFSRQPKENRSKAIGSYKTSHLKIVKDSGPKKRNEQKMETLKLHWREFIEGLPLSTYKITTGYYWNEELQQIEAWKWEQDEWFLVGKLPGSSLNTGGSLGLLLWAEQMAIRPPKAA
jgi:hypothetical protein